ncbi:MAG: alpha/beta hydrolase [Acetatifactor sp.]|nr:alpha/beta hydrolase [Acetatifactor sp.]
MLSARNEHLDLDGDHFDYISFGTGKDNLIMIPGVGDGFKTAKGMAIPFSILYRTFAEKYRVYVFSRRNPLPSGFSIQNMAEDIARMMDKIGLKKADVFGVSQGGMIAQQLAVHFPEKVSKLVLVVTSPGITPIMEEALNDWLEMSKQGQYRKIMLDTAMRSYTGDYLKKSVGMYRILSDFSKPKDFSRFQILCKACLSYDAREQIHQITCPTYVIGGGQDMVLGVEASKELADKIPGSVLYIYEELSHGLYEQAKDFNERVLGWLAKE